MVLIRGVSSWPATKVAHPTHLDCLPSLLLFAKYGRQAPRQGCLAGQVALRDWLICGLGYCSVRHRPFKTQNENSGLGIYQPGASRQVG